MREPKQYKTKKLAAMLIMLAVPFFVVLGMRIAYIKGDFEKAKQRPRATIEETHKQFAKLVIVKQTPASPTLLHGVADAGMPLLALISVVKPQPAEQHPVALPDLRRIPPRASPLPFPAPLSRTA